MNQLLVSLVTLLTIWCPGSKARYFDSNFDISGLVDQLEDEVIGHEGLNPSLPQMETKLGGDEPHPVIVNNWGHDLDVGDVSAVDVDQNDNPVIFHRGSYNKWTVDTFDNRFRLRERKVIKEEPIVVLRPEDGSVLERFGSGLFYMPHGLTVDQETGDIYATDVGLHQVLRIPNGKETPDLILGEAFEPGSDKDHFCQPTSVAVAKNGNFFVADGYCNSRVMVYDKTGNLINIIEGQWTVAHSLALFEREDVLCIADREGRKVDCVKAGLGRPKYANKDETGTPIASYNGIGRVYAIAGKGTALLALMGQPNVRGVTIDTAENVPTIIDEWGTKDGITMPHDVAISNYGDAVYVVDLSEGTSGKVRKYEVTSDKEDLLI